MSKQDVQVFNKFQRFCAKIINPFIWCFDQIELRAANKRYERQIEEARLERLAQSIASSKKNFR